MMKLLMVPILLLCIVVSGCGDSDGATGLQASQGRAGVAAPSLASGASVMTFTLPQGTWKEQGIQESSSWPVETITADVVSDGTVLVYMDEEVGVERWTALPVSGAREGFETTLSYAYEPGIFRILLTKNTDAPLLDAFKGHRIRVVVIVPDVTAGLQNLDAGNYTAVAERFGL